VYWPQIEIKEFHHDKVSSFPPGASRCSYPGRTLAFADSGEATYKAKCATCHGPAGTPSAGMAKMMGIKAVSDPSMKALSAADMTAAVKNGKGKMKPVAGSPMRRSRTWSLTSARSSRR